MPTSVDRNCLSYWFPRLAKAGVPVPKTRIVSIGIDLTSLLDGVRPVGLEAFLGRLSTFGYEVGWPCFLRTGHTSGKHEWNRTCYVPHPDALEGCVASLVEYSAMADILGLPTAVWAVRELLPTKPVFHAFREMPVNRERRYFFENGRVVKHIPYWPEGAFEKNMAWRSLVKNPDLDDLPDEGWRPLLQELNRESEDEVDYLSGVAEHVAREFDGAWSLDFLWTQRGWYAIDMAEAERSWGWKEDPDG